jgi:uncharacterized protein DUF2735
MTMSNSRETAKIYAFPAGGRFAASSKGEEFTQPANVQVPHAVLIASGSGWYHDEAIQTEQRRKS